MIRPRSGQSLISSTNAFTVFSGLWWREGRDVSSAVCIPIQDWYILSDYQHRWCWCWLAVSHSAGCFVLLIAKRQAKTQWTGLSWKLLMTVNWAELEAADTRRKVKEKSNVALSAETSFVSTWWWNSKHVGLCVCFVEIQGSAERTKLRHISISYFGICPEMHFIYSPVMLEKAGLYTSGADIVFAINKETRWVLKGMESSALL